MNYYTGIGSQKTPLNIMGVMRGIGQYMASEGWTLRSGGASGADISFEEGSDLALGKKEIYIPWKRFNHSQSELHPEKYPFSQAEMEFSAKFHPAWHRCSPSVRLLHQRNTRQIFGLEAIHGEFIIPTKFVICWTTNGTMTGGTSQALRIATAYNIPIFNFGLTKNEKEIQNMLLSIDVLKKKIESEKTKNV